MTVFWAIIWFFAGASGSCGLAFVFYRKQQMSYDREIAELEQRMSVLAPIWGDERNDKAFR